MAKRFSMGRWKRFASMPQAIPEKFPPSSFSTPCQPVTTKVVLQYDISTGKDDEAITSDSDGYIKVEKPLTLIRTTGSAAGFFRLEDGACVGMQKTLIFSSGSGNPPSASISGAFPNNMTHLIILTGSSAEFTWTCLPVPIIGSLPFGCSPTESYWASSVMPSGCYGCSEGPKAYLTGGL